MIASIEVKNLFGVFNHRIELNHLPNITLILGENGLGKTIILKLVQAFYDGNLTHFREYVFDQFILEFDNENILIVHRNVPENKRPVVIFEFLDSTKKKPLKYTLPENDQRFSERKARYRSYDYGRERMNYRMDRGIHMDELEYFIDRYFPFKIERIGADRWLESGTKALYSTEDLIRKYSSLLPPEISSYLENGTPIWLRELCDGIPVKLIETQRLLVKAEEGKYRSSVTDYSKQLMATIKNKRSEATDLGSNLDRSYPNRVIEQIEKGEKTEDTYIRESFVLLQQKRALLNDVGLLDTEEEQLQPSINVDYDKKILNEVLSVYIDDSNKKLSIYDDLSSRIKLLLDIINKRFTYKSLSIDKTEGFLFTSTINNKKIPLNGLSSGEQHELVLFFELLFNTKENSLLLIDEPEISLHISWQKKFIQDLSSVAELNNLAIIIATHSPDIIGNNWPLTVQLRGGK